MMNWHKDGNFDRIAAFSHALVLAREFDKKNIQPDKKTDENRELTRKEREDEEKLLGRNKYGMTRSPKYGSKFGSKY
jgi:hypothetical protein